MEDVDFLINFVVKNSNKLRKIKFKKENELSVFPTSHLVPTTQVMLSIHEGLKKLICFVLLQWNLPTHGVLVMKWNLSL